MENTPIRVLLVEDDEDDYILAEDYLTRQASRKFAVIWVQSFEAGLEAIKKGEHDVCLLDYRLGGDNGLELLKLAANGGHVAPVIMLTGLDDREMDLAALKAGAADYLVKSELTVGLLERTIHYALERANLIAEIKGLAVRDELTGLFNRRELFRILDYEIERHLRYGSVFSLILLDVDGLKRVNDEYGHLAGDKLLGLLGQTMLAIFRSTDLLARYGGDEFVVVLPETSTEGALMLAERLLHDIFSHPFAMTDNDGKAVRITPSASIGIAEYPDDADNVEALLNAADQALYSAKKQGGNQAKRAQNDRQGSNP